MAYFPAPGYMPAYNPTLPYHQPVPGGLHPGMSVYVQGTVPKHTKRFRVNFACGQHEGGDIPFHFNPRFDGKDKTVLNTFQCGKWGNEEIHKMPFQKGEHFEIIFIVKDIGYQILVNRNPFCSYGHRMPPQSVQINMMPNPGYGPPQNLPPVPYTGNISGGLGAKRTIIVRGSIPMNFNRFHINLKAGQDIALHINPRRQEQIVVRNSFLNGSWGPEERELPFNPFQPGQYFELSIRCGNHRFKVYVNGQPFFNYAHRYRNFPQINSLQIDGDISICCDRYKFKVYTSGRHLFNFAPPYGTMRRIRTLEIKGDILLNGKLSYVFRHRIPPQSVRLIRVNGNLELQSLKVMTLPVIGNLFLFSYTFLDPEEWLPHWVLS
ncbi:Galectin-4, partial [Ophiophagus hannah]